MALHRIWTGFFILFLLCSAGPASAVISPPLARLGELAGYGWAVDAPILIVPNDSMFVLTNLTWSSVANLPRNLRIQVDLYGDSRLCFRESLFLLGGGVGAVQVSLTGEQGSVIVFRPGESVRLVLSTCAPSYSWSALWSGEMKAAACSLPGGNLSGSGRPSLTAYPNPASGPVSLSMDLPRAGDAQLRVYDVEGRLVRDLYRGAVEKGARRFCWDGRDDRAHLLGGGVFYALLSTPSGIARTRIVRLN